MPVAPQNQPQNTPHVASADRRVSIASTPLAIGVVHFIVLISAIWSITTTWLDYIYFTVLSFVYLPTTIVGIADCVRHAEFWSHTLRSMDEIGTIVSLPLIATQLCLLAEVPKEISVCNIIPPFTDLLIMLRFGTGKVHLSDFTLAAQIVIILYCAYVMKSTSAGVIAFFYAILYYGPEDPDQRTYGPIISIAMCLMGEIAITHKESLFITNY